MNSLNGCSILDNIGSQEQEEPENDDEFEVCKAQSPTASNQSRHQSSRMILIGLTMGSPLVNQAVKETEVVG